jgi:hypothetical protein
MRHFSFVELPVEQINALLNLTHLNTAKQELTLNALHLKNFNALTKFNLKYEYSLVTPLDTVVDLL